MPEVKCVSLKSSLVGEKRAKRLDLIIWIEATYSYEGGNRSILGFRKHDLFYVFVFIIT